MPSIDELPRIFGHAHLAPPSVCSTEGRSRENLRDAQRSTMSRDSIESVMSSASTLNHASLKQQELELDISDAILLVEDKAARCALTMLMRYMKEVKAMLLNKIDHQEQAQKSSAVKLEDSMDAVRKWVVGWKDEEPAETPKSAAPQDLVLSPDLRRKLALEQQVPASGRISASKDLCRENAEAVKQTMSQLAGDSRPKPAELKRQTRALPPSVDIGKEQAAERLDVSSLPTWLRVSNLATQDPTKSFPSTSLPFGSASPRPSLPGQPRPEPGFAKIAFGSDGGASTPEEVKKAEKANYFVSEGEDSENDAELLLRHPRDEVAMSG